MITEPMNTRRSNGRVPCFAASQESTEYLQAVLVDLIELRLQSKQAHWTVVGQGFRELTPISTGSSTRLVITPTPWPRVGPWRRVGRPAGTIPRTLISTMAGSKESMMES